MKKLSKTQIEFVKLALSRKTSAVKKYLVWYDWHLGHGHINTQTFNALIKKGIYEQKENGLYDLTDLGKQITI